MTPVTDLAKKILIVSAVIILADKLLDLALKLEEQALIGVIIGIIGMSIEKLITLFTKSNGKEDDT